MNVFNNSFKVEEYKPISILSNGKYLVNFNKKILTEEEKVLKNSTYVKTGKLIPTGRLTCKSIIFSKKPSISEIQSIVFEFIDNSTVDRIKNGFTWNGYSTYLSTENQMNYKNAFDLTIATDGENLPITFKFSKGGKTEYYKFDNVNELKDFYISMSNHITKCLDNGWKEKDKFIPEEYKI